MPLTFERKLSLILFFVFLMLSLIGLFSYQSTISHQEALNWEKHAQEVLSKLDETLTLSVDIETGMRGFVVTDNETYLEPYHRAKRKIPQNIQELRAFTAQNPNQTAEIDRLEASINKRIEDADKNIDLRRREGFEIAISGTATQEGKVLMEQIRESTQKLKNEELNLLRERERGLDQSRNRTIIILIISSLAGMVSLGLANIVVFSEIKRRRNAETALIDANQDLEKKIDERTSELQKANESLLESGTERERLLQNEQEARKEAEIANRLRDEFMATVSHELRTPLNSILGWARLLNDGSLDEDQSTKAVRTIIKNSETQNRLIEDLLDVARIISGKLDLDITEIDPVDLVTHAIETVTPEAETKGISITSEISGNTAEKRIAGDKNRMRQIVWNLLANAIKFTPKGGKVGVSLRSDNDFVEIEVADDGVGISKEFLPDVFERFRQDFSTTRKQNGLGLGLAIVRNLTEMHGGSVSVASSGENKGSTFTVKFPAAN